ncbi:MAG: lantibiotic dehydratase, partial [Actinomycetota bacterium]|nr:lantibiotic dehydratase [Actinomycetota bacterium]
ASPTVHAALENWRTGDGALSPRLERTLVSYLLRAGGRATPFGLFAGCAMARLDDATRLSLKPPEHARRRSRLDFGYLDTLVTALTQSPEVRAGLVVRPNSTVYVAGGRVRYAASTVSDDVRSYRLAATAPTDAVAVVLGHASLGRTVDKLADALRTELEGALDISAAKAFAFVSAMVDEQLLVPVAAPQVTGDAEPHVALEGMPDVPAVAQARTALAAAAAQLRAIDGAPLGQSPAAYLAVQQELAPLPVGIDLARLVQVDAGLAAGEISLGLPVRGALMRGVDLLARICPAGPDRLAGFRDEFAQRYETRAVPLLEVLDEEAGIGYQRSGSPAAAASPLAAGLPFPREEPEQVWRVRDRILLGLLATALREGQRVLRLTEADIEQLTVPAAPLPGAFHVHATVCAEDDAAVDAGQFTLLLRHVGGPAGASLLGRFCHLDPRLRQTVTEHLRAEEACDPGRVYAEIVHLPEGRAGNVIARPLLRGYEIPFLGRSGAPADRQIPLSDLTVTVDGGRVVLWSLHLGCEVVPRLTTAHNCQADGLAIYRFLCDLQFQGVRSSLGWDWGVLDSAPYLPRMVADDLVLARARWRLEPAQAAALRAAGPAESRYAAVQAWRERAQLPRWVALAEDDNELVIDLDNVLCVEVLLSRLKQDRPATVVELFPGPEDMCLHGPGGRYAHEIVVAYLAASRPDGALPAGAAAGSSQPLTRLSGNRPDATVDSDRPRRFPPGSAWLYVRLYGGEASADDVLREAIWPLTREARSAGSADQWFFLRYRDPDGSHLRVRWQGDGARLAGELLPQVRAAIEPLLDAGLLWRMDVGTYEREVERYGGSAGAELAERLFDADSDFVLEVLSSAEGDELAEARWRLALAGADRLLADLG